MKFIHHSFVLMALTTALSGCAVGYDYALFSTKSNFGLDADTKPPTLELGISRRETALIPAYSDGEAPPLYGDFGANNVGALNKFFLGLSSTFAGADAALAVTDGDPPDQDPDWKSCVALPKGQEPYYKILMTKKWKPAPPNEIRPFSFGTDTTFGLKATWITPASAVPDAVKIGFNRKEFALAPVYMRQVAKCPPNTQANSSVDSDFYEVNMPAFFSLIDIRNNLTDFKNNDVSLVQVFATGKAAVNTAKMLREQVQNRVKAMISGTGNSGANR